MSDAGVSADAIAEMLAVEMTAAGRAADLGSGLHAVHRVVASVPTQVEAEDQRRLVIIANLARARASLDCAANYLAARSTESATPSRLKYIPHELQASTNESVEVVDEPAIDEIGDKNQASYRHGRVKKMTSAAWDDRPNNVSCADALMSERHDRLWEDQLADSTLLVVPV